MSVAATAASGPNPPAVAQRTTPVTIATAINALRTPVRSATQRQTGANQWGNSKNRRGAHNGPKIGMPTTAVAKSATNLSRVRRGPRTGLVRRRSTKAASGAATRMPVASAAHRVERGSEAAELDAGREREDARHVGDERRQQHADADGRKRTAERAQFESGALHASQREAHDERLPRDDARLEHRPEE